MGRNRLEAFSDGVLAIVITIMVLELKPPHEASLAALMRLWPIFLGYVLSFLYIGIYWNNHHHLLHMVRRVSAGVLWSNLHLLFWLSLVPFATAWMGENHFAAIPTTVYGVNLLLAGVAYFILHSRSSRTTDRTRRWRRPLARISRERRPSASTVWRSRWRGAFPGGPGESTHWSPRCGWCRTGASRRRWSRSRKATPGRRRKPGNETSTLGAALRRCGRGGLCLRAGG